MPTAAVLAISSISPTDVPVGSTDTPVVVKGTGFTSNSVIALNGTAESTTFVSATELHTTVPAPQLKLGQVLSIAVTDGSNTVKADPSAVALNIDNPVPTLSSISTEYSVVGSSSFVYTLLLNGTNFVTNTTVVVNGSARVATYISSTQIAVPLLPTEAKAGTAIALTLTNPKPGGTSVSGSFTTTPIVPATPVITSVTPGTIPVGTGNYEILVNGTNLFTTSKIYWGTTQLVSTSIYNSATTLEGQVPASLLVSKGVVNISVSTPGAASTSNALTIQVIDAPAPKLTSLSAYIFPTGQDATFKIEGSNFTTATQVSYNGMPVPTTYSEPYEVAVTIPASMLTLGPGVISATTPNYGTSNTLSLTIYVPLPNNSMIYNPVDGLLYLSVPSSAGSVYGNSVVSMDPATGTLGKPIQVGSEPNKLALTSDGRYLWVGLDGAVSVRQVDLVAETAGTQFALDPQAGTHGAEAVSAIAAMPGAPDSVIVLQSGGSPVPVIYDHGVARGTPPNPNAIPFGVSGFSLQVDGNLQEIHVSGIGLANYTYDASGISLKPAANSSAALGNVSISDVQLASGALYGSLGGVYDAESGGLLGNLILKGQFLAKGSVALDTASNKLFVLDSSTGSDFGYDQIQIFDGGKYTSTGSVIPLVLTHEDSFFYPNRLSRWGMKGLAFRASYGVFSLQSDLVNVTSEATADLAVTASASAATNLASISRYTFAVTNSGPATATGVALAITGPVNGVVSSAVSTAGECPVQTSTCRLGDLPSGGTATVTVSVLQTATGVATVTGKVSATTTDQDLTNNSASASVVVTGVTR